MENIAGLIIFILAICCGLGIVSALVIAIWGLVMFHKGRLK
jgi:hypothetical protein